MKQLQQVTTFSLIIALTGLSPMVAADSRTTSDDERIQPDQRPFDSPLSYHLTLEQMDGINAGGRSGQPNSVNSSSRSGRPQSVNSSSRSGRPDSVNTTGRSGQPDAVNSGRSGRPDAVNTVSDRR